MGIKACDSPESRESPIRRACWQMGEAIADIFAAVVARSPRLAADQTGQSPSWQTISKAWQR